MPDETTKPGHREKTPKRPLPPLPPIIPSTNVPKKPTKTDQGPSKRPESGPKK